MTWKKVIEEQKVIPSVNELFKKYELKKQEVKEGLRIGVYGEAGVGKTRFILTSPKPLFILDTELGTKDTLVDYSRNNDIDEIYVFEVLEGVERDDGTIKADVDKSLSNVETAIQSILKYTKDNPDTTGTIAIDSMSDVWDWMGQWLIRQPNIKKTSTGKPQQLEWQYANERYLLVLYDLLMLYKQGWNIILTGRLKEEYIGAGIKTGEIKGAWQKWTQGWVSIIIFMFKEYYMESDAIVDDPVSRKISRKFKRGSLIEKCRVNGSIEGNIYYDLNWNMLVGEIYG